MNTHRVADTSDQLLVDATPLDKLEDNEQLTETYRKREYDEEDDDKDVQKRRAVIKQSRRHNWQPKYAMEFGLLAIERDAVSGDVLLAMCGFCKAYGREGKYDQLVRQDQEAGIESKKRRRRSLTTTKFFRAFRVDNIRSHLQGAHPRRWAEYEVLPKQETVRARYLQLQGELPTYDHLPMVDDVVLGGSALNAEPDMNYAQPQSLSQASVVNETQHAAVQAVAQVATAQAAQTSTGVNGASHSTTQLTASLNYNASGAPSTAASASFNTRGTFDYEKHLTEQIALDRERLEFEKIRFKKEVELRERDLALREKHMEQTIILQEKLCDANRESAQLESAKFYRLAEVLRDAISGAQSSSETASVV
ncbi:unnamed protein product [Peronospora belbahrii]|uniref:Uncharacterized protein n=1 Tax=Peronospora belbahrii TaxID=622444 RepID=A0AAU9KGJ3_9STRA|nr:unnamed protein product [Peronospora belbahrii]CAH0513316.1 unnamed protein product [Peronospora belbahrii]